MGPSNAHARVSDVHVAEIAIIFKSIPIRLRLLPGGLVHSFFSLHCIILASPSILEMTLPRSRPPVTPRAVCAAPARNP